MVVQKDSIGLILRTRTLRVDTEEIELKGSQSVVPSHVSYVSYL